jgi:hypothetical protein
VFEYKCPSCKTVNTRSEKMKRLVCSKCAHEWELEATWVEYYHPWRIQPPPEPFVAPWRVWCGGEPPKTVLCGGNLNVSDDEATPLSLSARPGPYG